MKSSILVVTIIQIIPIISSFSISLLQRARTTKAPNYYSISSSSSSNFNFNLQAKQKDTSENTVLPPNEFPRPINVNAVLIPRRRRNYITSISAKPNELTNLATRFKLPSIATLDAELTLLIDSPGRRRTGGSGASDDTLYVEGLINATLTQTCVRTNDEFDVDLNLSFFAAVRAISWDDRDMLHQLLDGGKGMDDSKSSNYKSRQGVTSKKQTRSKQKGTNHHNTNKQQGRNLDDLGMMELQNLMTDMDYFDHDDQNDLIEDDAVYKDGILDGGELVAQIFRSKLDPYPKKPGSEPVQISIQG